MNDRGNIDRRKALQWLEGDERMLARIRAIFVKNVPSQVERLKMCLDAGDAVTVENLAHTVMGSAAMLGAGAMSDEAGKIERSAMDGDMNTARFHYARFVAEYEEVMKELTSRGARDEHPDR